MAEILREGNVFHLRNNTMSYALCELPGGVLAHLYCGPRLESVGKLNALRHGGVADEAKFSVQECSLDKLPQEYPSFGLGDMREGAVTVIGPDGTGSVDLRLVGAEVLNEKPALEGLPATRGEGCAALRLKLRDAHTGLEAELNYAIYDDCAAVARSARLINTSDKPMTITRAFSLCLDLPDANWELITLAGSWARERSPYRRKLAQGHQGISSQRGASSLQASPFMAMARPGANEAMGDVIGVSLIYSGNFAADVEVDHFGTARMLLGVNDLDFAWQLLPGASFQTPEAVIVVSEEGIGGMSHNFHALWENHLLPKRWVGKPRPVLLNSWEAAYFDFDADKLVAIAADAAKAGVELFVMDDGWFGHRDDDTTSLGDWGVDRKKLPDGLAALGDRVRAQGIQFGIWMEPEMISQESDLFRAHPDWCIHIPGRESITSRHQLILDLSRQEVQDFIVDAVTDTLKESGATYLKWDMNRNFSNIGSASLPPERQRELPHRYMLGLYAVMERLVTAFPDVLFEGCSSGGGRFDAGLLYYVPQYWCSDDTDALMRCRIQYGTTMVFPASTMGCHVSAVPNHQTRRETPLETRFAVSMAGCFGYELDPRKLSEEERKALRGQVEFAERTQELRLYGTLHRLLSPFEGNDTAWISVSKDRNEAIFTFVRAQSEPNVMPPLVRLRGLDAGKTYKVNETGETYGGGELMKLGLALPVPFAGAGDAQAFMYTLTAID